MRKKAGGITGLSGKHIADWEIFEMKSRLNKGRRMDEKLGEAVRESMYLRLNQD